VRERIVSLVQQATNLQLYENLDSPDNENKSEDAVSNEPLLKEREKKV